MTLCPELEHRGAALPRFTSGRPQVWFNYVTDQRRCWIDPQMRPRIAAFSRTVQFIFPVTEAADFHLTTVKFSLADNAKTLVLERSPFSKPIFSTQYQEPIVEFKMYNHNAEGSLLIGIDEHNRAAG